MGLIRCSQRRLGSRYINVHRNHSFIRLVKMGDTDDTFAPQYEYHILEADGEHLKLAAPKPGAGDWGEAWFWNFKTRK